MELKKLPIYSALCRHRTFRTLIPFVLMILSVILASTAFYVVQAYGRFENDTNIQHNVRFHRDGCADVSINVSFWKSFYFVGTVFSSIGYGDVVPCTWVGKLLTVLSTVSGVPLTLFCLSRLGKHMSDWANNFWLWCGCQRRQQLVKEAVLPTDSRRQTVTTGQPLDQDRLPLIVGILATCVWIVISAAFFYSFSFTDVLANVLDPYGEGGHTHSWTYLDAVYFTIVSLFTIGFGDYYPTNRSMDVATFFFIYVGLAMVSMCIAIATKKVETRLDKAVKMIQKVYEKQQQASSLPENPQQAAAILAASEGLDAEASEVAKLVLTLWNADPEAIWLRPLLSQYPVPNGIALMATPNKKPQIGRHTLKLMVAEWKRKVFRRDCECQTELWPMLIAGAMQEVDSPSTTSSASNGLLFVASRAKKSTVGSRADGLKGRKKTLRLDYAAAHKKRRQLNRVGASTLNSAQTISTRVSTTEASLTFIP